MGALFFRPETEEEALKLLSSSENPLIINGGTDAVLFLKEGKIKGDTLISIASIKEYGNIKEKDGWIEIGGTVTVDKMMSSPLLSEFSGLTEAMDHMASPAMEISALQLLRQTWRQCSMPLAPVSSSSQSGEKGLSLSLPSTTQDAPTPQ